jgi:hypothetical protein
MAAVYANAANEEKSGEEVMPHQFWTPAVVDEDQLSPPSMEKYKLPPGTEETSFFKSGVPLIPLHTLLPALVLAVHVTPLSLDT